MNDAVKHFTACIDSAQSSSFLRAVARYYRARALLCSPKEEDTKKAKKDILVLIQDHPDSAFAAEAKRLLKSK
jgi:hypothetical protein